VSRTTQLYDLQQVDTALYERVARHHAIAAALADHVEIEAARAAREAAAHALTEAQVAARLLTGEIEDLTAKISAEDAKLFGGAVKNPKELRSIELEVESLKRRKTTLEDRLLDAMAQVEARQVDLTAAHEHLASLDAIFQQRQAGLLEDKDDIEKQLRALKVKRDRMVAEVPWADLQVYDRLRRTKRGLAVAAVIHDTCQGCHVTVPNIILRQLKVGQEIATCSSCTRILHMPGRGELVARDS